MKKNLFLMLLFINLTAFCQQTKKENRKISMFGYIPSTGNQTYDELLKFEAKYSTGVCLNTMGLGLIFAGLNQNRKHIAYAGGILSGISTIVIFTSYSHIKKAGLDEPKFFMLSLNENGIGIKAKL